MNKLFTKIATLSVGLAMAIGVGVAVGSGNKSVEPVHARTENGSYDITFTTGSGDGSTVTANSTDMSSITSSTYVTGKATSATKAYYGGSNGLKLGTGSAAGQLGFSLSTAGQVSATTVVITAKRYNTSNNTNVGLTTNATSKATRTTTNSSNWQTFSFDINDDLTSMIIHSDSKALWVQKVTVNYTYEVDDDTPAIELSANKLASKSVATTITATPNEYVPSGATINWSVDNASATLSASTGLTTNLSVSNSSAIATKITVTGVLKSSSNETLDTKTIDLYVSTDLGSSTSTALIASEAKELAFVTGKPLEDLSVYVKGYANNPQNKYVYLRDTPSSSNVFEIYHATALNIKPTAGSYVIGHGKLTTYNSYGEVVEGVIDSADYFALSTSNVEVNTTQYVDVTASSATGDIVWSTTPGTGSVTLTNKTNTGVRITGSTAGSATVTATVGNYSQSISVTVQEYATDWVFNDITLTTGEGFVDEYEKGDDFDDTGIIVTLYEYSETLKDNPQHGIKSTVLDNDDVTFNFDTYKNTVGDFNLTATFEYDEVNRTTDDVVTITIIAVPGRVNFGNSTGNWAMSATPADYTDNLSHTCSATITTNGNVTNSASYVTIGNGSGDSTLTVIVDLGLTGDNKLGIESLSVSARTTKASGTLSLLAYADNDTNNVILSGTHAQSTDPVSTGDSYNVVNAKKIYIRISSVSNGMQVYNITYSTCEPAQEFGTLSKIEVKNTSLHQTTFKVGQKFSTAGLVILATDTVDFTKDYTSGFTTSLDAYKINAFGSGDVGNKTVTVSLTVGVVTKTVDYTITVINPPTYSLVESQSELFEGMKVLLVKVNDSVTAGAYGSSQYGTGSATIENSVITDIDEDTVEFTVRIYGDSFALQYGDKFISYYGSSNAAYQSSVLGADTAWTYSTEGSTTDGLRSANVTSRYLEFNGSKVACYTHTQASVRLYSSSASTKTAEAGAATFAYKYLHMRDYDPELHEGDPGDGYCLNESDNHYYSTAKAFYTSASFSADEKVEFAKLTDAVKRLQDWAKANKETFDPSAKTFTVNSGSAIFRGLTEDSNSAVLIIVVASIVSLTAIGGYFLFKKKKQY